PRAITTFCRRQTPIPPPLAGEDFPAPPREPRRRGSLRRVSRARPSAATRARGQTFLSVRQALPHPRVASRRPTRRSLPAAGLFYLQPKRGRTTTRWTGRL